MRSQRASVCASAAAVDTSKSPKSQGFTMPGAPFAAYLWSCICLQLTEGVTRPRAVSTACATAADMFENHESSPLSNRSIRKKRSSPLIPALCTSILPRSPATVGLSAHLHY